MKKVLISEGWKKEKKSQRKRSTSEPSTVDKLSTRNSSGYQGKKNPLGRDDKPFKCFKCNSEYHIVDKCDNSGPGKSIKTEAACVTFDSRRKHLDDVFALVSLDIKCEVKEDSKNTGKVVETDTSKDDHKNNDSS